MRSQECRPDSPTLMLRSEPPYLWGWLVTVEVGGFGISTYSINPNDSLTHIGFVDDPAAAASCWISAAGGFYYVSNAVVAASAPTC